MHEPRLRSRTSRKRRPAAAWFAASAMIVSALLAGCSPSGSFSLEKTLPESNAIAGWSLSEEVQTYTRETLFDYINGASEYYFTYTFEQAAVGRYEKTGGEMLNVEVWEVQAEEDAFGLFSGRTGGESVSVGGVNEATLETGSRLFFWQNRFYVSLTAFDTVADEDLLRFTEYISKALPTGGERPELIGRLPSDGLVAGSAKFFHQELAIQDRLWLGGENLLELGPETDAVLAKYQSGGIEWQLLIVQYPESSSADDGMWNLKNSAVDGLLALETNGPLLGAVFGQDSGFPAISWLLAALGK